MAFHSVLNDGRMKLNQILIGFLKCLLLSMPFQEKKKKNWFLTMFCFFNFTVLFSPYNV